MRGIGKRAEVSAEWTEVTQSVLVAQHVVMPGRHKKGQVGNEGGRSSPFGDHLLTLHSIGSSAGWCMVYRVSY